VRIFIIRLPLKNYFMKINIRLAVIFLSILLLSACNAPEKEKISNTQELKNDRLVLMHNPMGVRIEYNISKQELVLWISPKAKESVDYFDRNFSNRDDHTSIFDRISFPGLSDAVFDSCRYDPFHSIIYFKEQVVHLATLYDHPAVFIWFEKPGKVDFKTDKNDKLINRKEKIFHSEHPDRGYIFDYVAQIAEGEGHFQHQLQIDRGRSTYARAHLSPNEPLVIAGELKNKNVPRITSRLLEKEPSEWIDEVNNKVDEKVKYGRVVFEGHEKLQKLVDFNKRIWVSSQDHSGALHASIKRIYYLIWVREGGLACPWIGYTGWVSPLEDWNDFQLANPTEIYDEGPGGRFFGQLVNKKITKWQEDGAFYAIWSAFTHWTQTGDDSFVSGDNLLLMEEAMDWLERYCYDNNKGLFYRRYYCETPLKQSRDHGWDNAVGRPESRWDPAPYKGKDIIRSYDIYVNLLNYAAYVMLDAMRQEQGISLKYADKAAILADNMKQFFTEGQLPSYGELITDKQKSIIAGPYGMDDTDYQWALTLPPFYPDYINISDMRKLLFDDILEERDGHFLAAYFSVLASLDIAHVDQDKIMEATEYAAKECYKPWADLPLAYSMVEMSGYFPQESPHHIRPQMFTMGAWFGAMGNLGVRRLPFGIAVRPSKKLKAIENYEYKDALININYEGQGKYLNSIMFNGQKLDYTWQIPELLLEEGKNNMHVMLDDKPNEQPVITGSSMEMINIKTAGDNQVLYTFRAFGNNWIEWGNMKKKSIAITDKNNYEINHKTVEYKGNIITWFEGNGIFYVSLDAD